MYRLSKDLIWLIISLNGDMFQYHNALNTTRASSQVCRTWRNITLASPFLWAKLIDLDILRGASQTWRTELLRRTNNMPLCIKCRDFDFRRESAEYKAFVFNTLDTYWNRIETFMGHFVKPNDEPDSYWEPLFRAAPHLRTFHVTFDDDGGINSTFIEPSQISSSALFGGEAPMLQVLNCNFSLQTSAIHPFLWAKNLHTIQLDGIHLNSLLHLLIETQNLRILEVGRAFLSDDMRLPHASLPHLEYLRIFKFDTPCCFTLLDHLDFPSPIMMSFGIFPDQEDALLAPLIQKLSHFARMHFKTNPPEKLALVYRGSQSVTFTDEANSSSYDRQTFHIWLFEPYHIPLELDTTSDLLDVLALPELASTTELRLNIHEPPPCSISINFLACLTGITVLRVNPSTLDTLLDFQKTSGFPLIFPFLKDIVIDNQSDSGEIPGVLLRFIQERRALQALINSDNEGKDSVTTLDLTQCRKLNVGETLQKIDVKETDGLKVLWSANDGSVSEYVCGSGCPKPNLTTTWWR